MNNLGAFDPFPKGCVHGGASVPREVRRCRVQLPRFCKVGHLNHTSGCGAGTCPRRGVGLIHRLEIVLRSLSSGSRRRQGRGSSGTGGLRLLGCRETSRALIPERAGRNLGLREFRALPACFCSTSRRRRCHGESTVVIAEGGASQARQQQQKNKAPLLAGFWAGDEAATGHQLRPTERRKGRGFPNPV